MKKTKKLSLKKEKISSLTNSDMQSIKGGEGDPNAKTAPGSAGSSNNDFTCCWCTGGPNSTTCNTGPVGPTNPTTGGNLTCVSCP
ncbi:hypothetical protein CEY12_13390 [Chryseobacterium sp. T16E-39]|uniref:class I lanthipeptide n=1 Tax=Chryseobacterium sp. T16E-39 TaxID=2015076 RepID=UPI000B5B33CA|nr:class I lanthipeptide [Chryseobacterium sp. T16E-39]ASK31039.1 hypothetical protein CEY12_13390 [Chryseobacterium sp. T16E-39]